MPSKKNLLILATLLVPVVLAGCAEDPQAPPAGATATPAATPAATPPRPASGGPTTILQAGSSTVLPVAQAWAEEYARIDRDLRFVVSGGGTGGGFQQFCRGEIHVSDASRPIKGSEAEACAAKGITPFEIQVAIDGLAVVVPRTNAFVDYLNVEELNKIWTANASRRADTWAQVRPGWPDERIVLYGPGTDSGTFDYFVEVVIHPYDGSSSKGRSDYTPSEDDNVLVQGVSASPNGLGYFGLAYYEENKDRLRVVPIADKAGTQGVTPTAETVEAGAYKPLARPIFMYTNGKPTGALQQYFQWGLGPEGQALVEEVGYIKLPAARQAEMLAKLR